MLHKNGKEIKVLFVCYDPTIIESEKRCIELQGGLCVETASSNDEAVAKIEKSTPDVIVGDFTGIVGRARELGSELVRTLRSKGDITPFIVFSYDDEKRLVDEVCKSGVIGFVGKSFDPSVVYSALKSCIVSITRGQNSF
jgi:DNA-binding NarL/FixJ family response regulator